MRERLAAVGRLVDAVSPRHALAVARFAAADPEKIGVRLRDRDVADRERPLILEDRLEGGAVVRRFPHAAVRGGDVVQRGIGFVDREVGDASRHRCGTNRPEVQRIEWLAGRRCGGALLGSAHERSSSEHDGCGERHANQSIQLHRQRPPGNWMAAIIATEDTEHTDSEPVAGHGVPRRHDRITLAMARRHVGHQRNRAERAVLYSGPPCSNGSQVSNRGPLSSHTAKR